MIVHSTLHLYGFDHSNTKDSIEMETKEKDIIKNTL